MSTKAMTMNELDARVAELAARYRPLAAEILREVIRIPADYVDRPRTTGGDPSCGLSNHEKPRLEYLRRKIVEIGARPPAARTSASTASATSSGRSRTRPTASLRSEKRVIYFDGHTDTVNALRPAWKEKTGGVDAYDGLFDAREARSATS